MTLEIEWENSRLFKRAEERGRHKEAINFTAWLLRTKHKKPEDLVIKVTEIMRNMALEDIRNISTALYQGELIEKLLGDKLRAI